MDAARTHARPEHEAPRVARACRPARPAGRILSLQRSAGNRAVMSALRIDRKIEVRDVGRGEQSGFARVPEFIERLNGLSPSLNWKLEGRELVFEQTPELDAHQLRVADDEFGTSCNQENVLTDAR